MKRRYLQAARYAVDRYLYPMEPPDEDPPLEADYVDQGDASEAMARALIEQRPHLFTLDEVAYVLGVSRETVRKAEISGLRKIREAFEALEP